jgi:hypothetical protein
MRDRAEGGREGGGGDVREKKAGRKLFVSVWRFAHNSLPLSLPPSLPPSLSSLSLSLSLSLSRALSLSF